MNSNQKLVLKEYYGMSVCALQYQWDDESRRFSLGLLSYVAELYGEKGALEVLTEAVEGAACLQTAGDVSLLRSVSGLGERAIAAMNIKGDVLREYNIDCRKRFDPDLLTADVRERASRGEPHAMELWAYMNGEAVIPDADAELALRLWELLAINGRRTAMTALQAAYLKRGDQSRAAVWRDTYKLIGAQGGASHLYGISEANCSPEALSYASIIACIQSRFREQKASVIDIYMSDYALNSADPTDVKLKTIATENNFYLVMLNEQLRAKERAIGFV